MIGIEVPDGFLIAGFVAGLGMLGWVLKQVYDLARAMGVVREQTRRDGSWLQEHEQTLDSHGTLIAQHSVRLDDHGRRLDEHGRLLSANRGGD